MGKIYATNNPEVSEREQRNMERSRRIASQGMVLLQNDGTLPLVNKGKIALYGNGARCTVKGGTGSGDVNSRFVVNVEQGLTEAGFEITTRSWMDRYDRVIEAKRAAYIEEFKAVAEKEKTQAFWFLFYNPFKEPVMVPIEQEDITADETDTAVFVISRNSGEGKDRRVIAGEYELFEEEKAAIQTLVESYEKVIVVLNVGGVIDTRYLRSVEGINAILLMSQAGNIGGYALADILSGKQTPSGHLTDTRAENYGDYPGAADFYRMHTNAHIDERTIREIYLKGFEIAVKEAHPMSIMTSYNLINGIHTANSAELLTSIVRNE